MKKPLLFFAMFLFAMPFLKAQNSIRMKHVVFLEGEYVMGGKTLIYQLKDSTVQVIPYEYRKVFNEKTTDELAVLSWQMQDGKLGIPIQEYAIETLDVIKVRKRTARGRNMLIGMGIGVLASVVYIKHRKQYDDEFAETNYFDWTRIFFPPAFVGLGAIAGVSVPTLGKQFRINGDRKKYEEQKAALGEYAILK